MSRIRKEILKRQLESITNPNSQTTGVKMEKGRHRRIMLLVVVAAASFALVFAAVPGNGSTAKAGTGSGSTSIVLLAYNHTGTPAKPDAATRYERYCTQTSPAAYENIYIHFILCEWIDYVPGPTSNHVNFVYVGVYYHDVNAWTFWKQQVLGGRLAPVVSTPQYRSTTGGITGSTTWIYGYISIGRTLPKHTVYCITLYEPSTYSRSGAPQIQTECPATQY